MLYQNLSPQTIEKLHVFENLPFVPKRFFTASNLSKNEIRGGHSHYEMIEILLCTKGAFDVLLELGGQSDYITLYENEAILIPPNVSRTLFNFQNASYLGLCSTAYDPADYHK